jgi:hypothetical protein
MGRASKRKWKARAKRYRKAGVRDRLDMEKLFKGRRQWDRARSR